MVVSSINPSEPAPGEIEVHGPAELKAAMSSSDFWLDHQPALRLRGRFASAPDASRREKRIAFWRSICGCMLGAFAFLAGLAFQSWSVFSTGGVTFISALTIPALALLAAVIAKLVVLAVAKGLLALEIRALLGAFERAPAGGRAT